MKKKLTMAEPFFSLKEKKIFLSKSSKILNSSLSMGKNVMNFEEQFKKKMNFKYAIAMNSCTATLESALKFSSHKKKKVIISPQTFIANATAVFNAGKVPVFAKVNSDHLSIDYNDLKQKIDNNTAALILVHMYGRINPDIIKIKQICNKKKILLIEDCAHSVGAKLGNKYAGSFGDFGCFSFYPTKIITSAEGGMLVTNKKKNADYARSYQLRGRNIFKKDEVYNFCGRNVRMTEFSGLLGCMQLKKLNYYLKLRRSNAIYYKTKLSNIDKVRIPEIADIQNSSYWKFLILLPNKKCRDGLLKYLKYNKIFADKSYFPLLHKQPALKNKIKITKSLIDSEKNCEKHLLLPCHPRITKNNINRISNLIKKYLK